MGSSAVQKLRRALSPPSKFGAYDDTASREILVIKQRILITPKRPRASRHDQTNASTHYVQNESHSTRGCVVFGGFYLGDEGVV